MAAGFIADTASTPLVVSNLVNIVSADFSGIGFGRYASVMVPVNFAAVAATLAVLFLYFRRHIPARYDVSQLPAPRSAVRDPVTFRAGVAVLVLLLGGFFVLEPLGVPVSAIAAAGALILLLVAGRQHIVGTRRVMRQAPWHIVVFSLGMYLVVYGLRNAGLTAHLAELLDAFAEMGIWGAALGTGVVTAFLASVMNNLPAVLVGALAIADTGATGAVRDAMIYANVIGTDLGPKITPIGSLATLLWLHVLADHLGLLLQDGHRAHAAGAAGDAGCAGSAADILLISPHLVVRLPSSSTGDTHELDVWPLYHLRPRDTGHSAVGESRIRDFAPLALGCGSADAVDPAGRL